VKDDKGVVIGTGHLTGHPQCEFGTAAFREEVTDRCMLVCVVDFTVLELPDVPFYTVTIGPGQPGEPGRARGERLATRPDGRDVVSR
jgi:hypothetical protein